ncbi:MAG: DUF456 domain-containing protein [Deltaproteobacteria bacterium]|nr:DUF456 domain-containing protein [Deltaproteobacteria bacterium]
MSAAEGAYGVTIFILSLFAGVFLVALGLPGAVLIFISVLIFAAVTGFNTFGVMTILILFLIALATESLDIACDILGAKKTEFSALKVGSALVGAAVGSAIATYYFMGLGTLLGLFIGAFSGALAVEFREERKLRQQNRAGFGPTIGRIAVMTLKGTGAIVMTIIAVTSLYSCA